jgi:riboflavin synthase
LVLGESIAVMGVCLTVDAITADGFEADASPETMQRSTLANLPVGHLLHLERALCFGARLGGHLVSGHVDTTSRLLQVRPLSDAIELTFSLDPSIAPFVAEKGSIAVDGVSLTVNQVQSDSFRVAVIPHTQSATRLNHMHPGDLSNIEVDVLARYVARCLGIAKDDPKQVSTDASFLVALSSSGYL